MEEPAYEGVEGEVHFGSTVVAASEESCFGLADKEDSDLVRGSAFAVRWEGVLVGAAVLLRLGLQQAYADIQFQSLACKTNLFMP